LGSFSPLLRATQQWPLVAQLPPYAASSLRGGTPTVQLGRQSERTLGRHRRSATLLFHRL